MGSKKFHLGLIPKILIGILIGVLIGKSLPVWFTRIL